MKPIAALGLAFLLLAPARAQAPALPAWVSGLPLWEWHPIPNTALSSVNPSPSVAGISGPASKINAWCGATLKRQGSVYMLGAAGGHADYAGNEVDALQLNAAAPQWVQLRAPTPNAQLYDGSQYYADLRPSATHTYYATQFIDAQNRMLVFPSPGMGYPALPAPPAGFPYAGDLGYTFSFNVGTGDWEAPATIAQRVGITGDFTAALCVKHPVTEDVYYSRNYGGNWWRWTQATNTWVMLSNVSRGPWYAGAAIDPTRNRMLIVGSYGGDLNPEVRDLNGTSIPAAFSGPSLKVGGYAGVIYDEVNDTYLVVFNAGGAINVLRVRADTWVVDAPAMTGTPPTARSNGIQNSVQYVPELGGFVIANSHAGNVYFVRTSSAGGAVPAPPPAPAPPAPAPPAPSGGSGGGDDSRCSCGTIQGGGIGALAASMALLLGILRRTP